MGGCVTSHPHVEPPPPRSMKFLAIRSNDPTILCRRLGNSGFLGLYLDDFVIIQPEYSSSKSISSIAHGQDLRVAESTVRFSVVMLLAPSPTTSWSTASHRNERESRKKRVSGGAGASYVVLNSRRSGQFPRAEILDSQRE